MALFTQYRLRTRLIAGFLSVILLGAGVAAVGIHGLSRLNEQSQTLYDKELLGISHLKEANINLIYVGRARARLALAQNDQDRAAARQVMDKAFGDFDRSFSEARTRFYTDRGRALVTEVADMATAWRTVTQAYLAAATPEHLQQGSTELAALDRAVQQANRALDERLTELTRMKEQQGLEAARAGEALYGSVAALLVGLTALSAVLGVGIGLMLTHGLTRQLGGEPSEVAALAGEIASGNLGTHIDLAQARPGSVVAAMADMQQALRRLVGQVRTSSDSKIRLAARLDHTARFKTR